MSQDLESLPETALEPLPSGNNPFIVLMQSAIDKGIDPGKMLDLAERWEAKQAAKEFSAALHKFQSLMTPIEKTNEVRGKDIRKADNLTVPGPVHYLFASYEEIMEVAQPHLTACGITVTFTTKTEGQLMTTTCHVQVGSHTRDSSITLGLPTIPNANDAQRAGAALSYGKRYALIAALNIRVRGEDTDANGLDTGLPESKVVELNTLIEKLQIAGIVFDLWAAIGVPSMNELPESKFELAKWMLTQKLKTGAKK
jgi:hypothetical protein